MKIFKLITSCLSGVIVSLWTIVLWLLLMDPYNPVVKHTISTLPLRLQTWIESNTGFVILQILFITTISAIIICFYVQGYKDAKEKYDVTKNINN